MLNFLPFKTKWYSSVCINHILFIHSSISGYLGFFHLLAIVNGATLFLAIVKVIALLSVPVPVLPRTEGWASSAGRVPPADRADHKPLRFPQDIALWTGA